MAGKLTRFRPLKGILYASILLLVILINQLAITPCILFAAEKSVSTISREEAVKIAKEDNPLGKGDAGFLRVLSYKFY